MYFNVNQSAELFPFPYLNRGFTVVTNWAGYEIPAFNFSSTTHQANVSNNALNTLMLMANGILTNTEDEQINKDEVNKTKSVDFEGRGTVACHLCQKSFILKTLLKRHYITCHNYDPQCPTGNLKGMYAFVLFLDDE